jgi:hypothetical protein
MRRLNKKVLWTKHGTAVNHGTVMGYNTHGCRCDECWQAWEKSPSYQTKLAIKRAASDKAAS